MTLSHHLPICQTQRQICRRDPNLLLTVERKLNVYIVIMNLKAGLHNIKVSVITVGILHRAKKKICGFPVSSYKNLGRVGRF